MNSKSQLKCLSTYKHNPDLVYAMLGELASSVLMGTEGYLRSLDLGNAIPLLMSLLERYSVDGSHGDIITLDFRTLALILEHVPGSYEAALGVHKTIMKQVASCMHRALCGQWQYNYTDSKMLIEECLHVTRFIIQDDETGTLSRLLHMGDLLTLCADDDTFIARAALETLATLCSKLVLPSGLEKPSTKTDIFAFFKLGGGGGGGGAKGKKKRRAAGLAPRSPVNVDDPLVLTVENVIIPFLSTLMERYALSFAAVPETWPQLQLTLNCVDHLITRALLCHRPSTARLLVTSAAASMLFRLIDTIEASITLEAAQREERVLLCESLLALFTHCNRELMLDSLLSPEAHKFFFRVLHESTEELTTLLDCPFTQGANGALLTHRRDKDQMTSVAAIRLFVLACPNVPSDAYGLKPKVLLPVHQWYWEDEMRHANRFAEEHCATLEMGLVRLERCVTISTQSKNTVDLQLMSMNKETRGMQHNVLRSCTPFVFHFANEAQLRPVVANVKETGPAAEGVATAAAMTTASSSSPLLTKPQTHRRGTSLTMSHSVATAAAAAAAAHSPGDPSRSSSLLAARPQRASSRINQGSSSFSLTQPQLSMASVTVSAVTNMSSATCNNNVSVLSSASRVDSDLIAAAADGDHIAVAETYLQLLCQCATHASGQMARQLASCACASALQLAFSSTATARAARLMELTMLPLCEMFRETLASADKATKAVVLSMMEWVLRYGGGAVGMFCCVALRCGLLSQLTCMSKTGVALLSAVESAGRPTRTADLASKSGTLCHAITRHLTTLYPALQSMTEASWVLSRDATRLHDAAEQLRRSANEPGIHEAKLRQLFDVLHALSATADVTVFEIFQMDVAGSVLRYLFAGKTVEELFGDYVVYSSAGAGSTRANSLVLQESGSPAGTGTTAANADVTRPAKTSKDGQESPWSAMLAEGMRMADLLKLNAVTERVACLVACSHARPQALRHLVALLVAALSLHNSLPLVESPVTARRVVCRTTQQAFQAMTQLSPHVKLCGEGRDNVTSTGGGLQATEEEPAQPPRRPGATAAAAEGGDTHVSAKPCNPAEYCMQGHLLHEVSRYERACVCDVCGCEMRSGFECRACNFDICPICYISYTGNPVLGNRGAIEAAAASASAIARKDRAHLLTCVGDLERFFRTGSTSTKGTQWAPTTQSALGNTAAFVNRAQFYLPRYVDHPRLGRAARVLLAQPTVLSQLMQDVLQSFTRARPELNATVSVGGAATAAAAMTAASSWRAEGRADIQPDLRNAAASTRNGIGQDAQTASSPTAAALLSSVFAQPEDEAAARELLCAAVEERYTLYRPSVGVCPYHETFFSLLYRNAFATGNRQVLLQLESCLLRYDGSAEALTMDNFFAPTTAISPGLQSTPHLTPPRASTAHGTGGDGETRTVSSSTQRTSGGATRDAAEPSARQIALSPTQTYYFHHFERDECAYCACGAYTRETLTDRHSPTAGDARREANESAVEQRHKTATSPPLSLMLPDLARRSDMLLLVALHYFCYEKHADEPPVDDAAALGEGADRGEDDDRDGVFINSAITALVVKSFEASALRVSVLPPQFALPRWVHFVLRDARFLLPFAVREQLARFLACQARRSLILYMRTYRLYRLDRSVSVLPAEWARMSNHKFSVRRDHFMQDATALLRKCADARMPVSIEFAGDVGVGQGPTAQFFTQFARELCRPGLRLWRTTGDGASTGGGLRPSPNRDASDAAATASGETTSTGQAGAIGSADGSPDGADTDYIVPPPEGLYPRPFDDIVNSFESATEPMAMASATATTHEGVVNGKLYLVDHAVVWREFVVERRERARTYYAIGAALGRAFLDGQVFPLPLSPALSIFLRRGLPSPRLVLDVSAGVDASAEAPIDLYELALAAVRLVDRAIWRSLHTLREMDAATLAALELPFTLPGYDQYELIPGGAKVLVTKANLARYERRVVSALLYESVALPLRLLTMGCFDVLPREALVGLENDELMRLLCGEEKSSGVALWTRQEIKSVLVGDHGYQNDSPQLDMLARILGDRLTPAEQRRFLLFCTGCPRLPMGGVRALGAITVVKRADAFAFVAAARVVEDEDEDEDEEGGNGGGAIRSDRHNDTTDSSGAGRDVAGAVLSRCASHVVSRDFDTNPASSGSAAAMRPPTAEVGSASGDVVGRPSGSINAASGGGEATARREAQGVEWALPSVNTCFRYLKLPPYPSEDVMYNKLLLSITHTGDSFELS